MARPARLTEKQNTKLHRLIALFYYGQETDGDVVEYLGSYLLGEPNNDVTPGYAWTNDEIAAYVKHWERSIDSTLDKLYQWIEGESVADYPAVVRSEKIRHERR